MRERAMKLLLASDGSPGALHAADWVAVHYSTATKILVVVVAATFQSITGYGPSTIPEFGDGPNLNPYRRALEETEARLGRFSTKGFIRQGDPVSAILETAEQHHPDLLVVGHRGLRGISGLLLGSVAQGLVHRAPLPILIIPETKPAP